MLYNMVAIRTDKERQMKNVFDVIHDLVVLANGSGTLASASVCPTPVSREVVIVAVPGDDPRKLLGEYFADCNSPATAPAV